MQVGLVYKCNLVQVGLGCNAGVQYEKVWLSKVADIFDACCKEATVDSGDPKCVAATMVVLK